MAPKTKSTQEVANAITDIERALAAHEGRLVQAVNNTPLCPTSSAAGQRRNNEGNSQLPSTSRATATHEASTTAATTGLPPHPQSLATGEPRSEEASSNAPSELASSSSPTDTHHLHVTATVSDQRPSLELSAASPTTQQVSGPSTQTPVAADQTLPTDPSPTTAPLDPLSARFTLIDQQRRILDAEKDPKAWLQRNPRPIAPPLGPEDTEALRMFGQMSMRSAEVQAAVDEARVGLFLGALSTPS